MSVGTAWRSLRTVTAQSTYDTPLRSTTLVASHRKRCESRAVSREINKVISGNICYVVGNGLKVHSTLTSTRILTLHSSYDTPLSSTTTSQLSHLMAWSENRQRFRRALLHHSNLHHTCCTMRPHVLRRSDRTPTTTYILRAACLRALPPRAYLLAHVAPSFLICAMTCQSNLTSFRPACRSTP